ncbi:MAG TPA: M20/M25/M40 family metallo-hydrolase [Candidatus Acidoferrum sp.]|nr:M20/M25/M40 family metallo-hydrolase [Candidatus Acidoferrum sp.]
MMKWMGAVVAGLVLGVIPARAGQAESDSGNRHELVAVTGHEQQLTQSLLKALKASNPKTDNLGNVWVEFGAGSPHTLLVTGVDEPGYLVSGITSDGFLRVQRLPQAAPNSVFDSLHFAQPVRVVTRDGKRLHGVFAGLSVHLEPGRLNPPKMNHLDEMYVDIGAKSAEEVRAAGVDLLDVVAEAGEGEFKPFAANFGATSLLWLARDIEHKTEQLNPNAGKLTIAFVTQQWLGGRGLDRLLNEIHPDRMIYVGRLTAPKNAAASVKTPANIQIGSGVLVGVINPDEPQTGLASEFAKVAAAKNSEVTLVAAEPPRIAGYAAATPLPKDFVQLGIPVASPVTSGEHTYGFDELRLTKLLWHFFGSNSHEGKLMGTAILRPRLPAEDKSSTVLARLTETYGPSGHEGLVREKVKELLPEWARKKAETDAAGNLVLRLGSRKQSVTAKSVAFIAHTDEIGYEIKKIEDNGRLLVDSVGGGYPQYFLGHAVLIQASSGNKVGGVLELPEGWDKPNFEWPLSLRGMDEGQHVYVGTKSKEETENLGIKAGDWLTIPKEYRPLLGTRANARSFDDRVGCAALIEAVQALGPNPEAALRGRDVTFVWSTEEEVGLKGAAAFAEQAAKEGRVPDFVFAIDTFVSSDSPLEVKRFGDAELGKGFVVRAVDNSNVVPLEYVDRVVKLAKENSIPVQYGVTGGGNDGAVFTRYGSVDVALGWPLRYSHSPGEVIDTKDADALAKIVEVLARSW